MAGVAASFAAANELPALSWLAALTAILFWFSPKRSALILVPSMLPVALGFFGTNFMAHGTWKPAYAHRSQGPKITEIAVADSEAWQSMLPAIKTGLASQDIEVSEEAIVRAARRAGVWELWDPSTEQRFAMVRNGRQVNIHEWGDWYDYPGSYWLEGKKKGVDQGEPNRLVYAFHSLFGHHGIFSLTPLWLLIPIGLVSIFRQAENWNVFKNEQIALTLAIVATSIVSVGFLPVATR